MAKQEFNDAINLFQPYLKDNPKSSAGHYYLGLAYLGNNNVQQAKTELAEAVKLNPRWVEARLILGDLYLRTGAVDLAIEEGNEILKINPNSVQGSFTRWECLSA